MPSYDELIDLGDKAQYDHRPRLSSRYYSAALRMGGDRDAYLHHQRGVNAQLDDDHAMAFGEFSRALEEAGDDLRRRGNVLRDMAESHRELGQLDQAQDKLVKSAELLEQYPVDYANTLHFQARLLRSRGRISEALSLLENAFTVLEAENDRNRLYVLLDQADTLAIAGNKSESREKAKSALRLAWQLGGWPQRVRALRTRLIGNAFNLLARKYVTSTS